MKRRQMTRTKLSVNYDRIYKIYSCKNYDIITGADTGGVDGVASHPPHQNNNTQ